LKNIMEEKIIEKSSINGSIGADLFLVMGSMAGSVSGEHTKDEVLVNYYYGYVKDKLGAGFFAKFPAHRVRIVEDADSVNNPPYITGYINKNCRKMEWD